MKLKYNNKRKGSKGPGQENREKGNHLQMGVLHYRRNGYFRTYLCAFLCLRIERPDGYSVIAM